MPRILPENIELFQTCCAYPEQYDAIHNGDVVGYLRLRGGYFRVDVPHCGGDTIYEANPVGDGEFEDDEREFYLEKAKQVIANWHNARQTPAALNKRLGDASEQN